MLGLWESNVNADRCKSVNDYCCSIRSTCIVDSSVMCDSQTYQNVCNLGHMVNRIIIVGIRRSFPKNTECLLN